MRPLLLTAALALLVPPACQHFAFTKADATAVDMGSAAQAVSALQVAAASTQEAYEGVLAATDLRGSFKRFERDCDRFDRATAEVVRSIEAVEKRTNDFLAAYAKQREEIKNPDLRAAMLMRREAIERQVTDMKVELSAMLAAADSLSRELKDLRVFFSANLNEQAVRGAQVVGEKLRTSVAGLDSSAARVSLELTDLSTSLSSDGGK